VVILHIASKDEIAFLMIEAFEDGSVNSYDLEDLRSKANIRKADKEEPGYLGLAEDLKTTLELVKNDPNKVFSESALACRFLLNRDDTEIASSDESESPAKKTQITKKQRQKKDQSQSKFTFDEGRIFFDNKDLDLPTGRAITILTKLISEFDRTVAYKDLSEMSSVKEADANLRKDVSVIRGILKTHKIPCVIKTKTRSGYVLTHKQP